MTAFTKATDVPMQTGKFRLEKVAASTTIYQGQLVGLNAAGYVVDVAAGLAGTKFLGVAADTCDNSAGTAGAKSVLVYTEGAFMFATNETAAIGLVGKLAYVYDNGTVTTAGYGKPIGWVLAYSAADSKVVVKINELPPSQFAGMKVMEIPFSKQTSEYDSTYDIPAYAIVCDVQVKVVDNVAASTIDVGILASESGDADGFVDGASCATAGWAAQNFADATEGNITVGALLSEVHLKDANSVYCVVKRNYPIGNAAKSISYTTSDHAIAGYIYVFYMEA